MYKLSPACVIPIAVASHRVLFHNFCHLVWQCPIFSTFVQVFSDLERSVCRMVHRQVSSFLSSSFGEKKDN